MSQALHVTALRLLAARALSERELADRLQRRGFSPEAVAGEVARLREAGLLDDVRLARALCADFLRRGFGRKRLAAALGRRGVAAEAARQALAEVSAQDEEAALHRALERVGRAEESWRLSQKPVRVVRYLLARGFPAALARRVGGSSSYAEDAE